MSSSHVNDLFGNAKDEGALSPEAMNALNVTDIGAQIQAALGVNVDDVTASEVVLVTMMPDDSGSIRFAKNTDAVIDGHNLVLSSLTSSKQKDSVLAHTRYLNGHILYPYCQLDKAVKMDHKNYDPNAGTPLYDQTIVLLGTVLAKSQEFANNGVPVRTVTLIITDGGDAHSSATAAKVKPIVRDMLMAETHIIAAMGVDDGSTDFKKVFQEMGIDDRWILTCGNSAKEIRAAFQLFSQSAVRASQGAASFSQAAMGGFGN